MKNNITIQLSDIDYAKLCDLADEKKWSKSQTAQLVIRWAFNKNVENADL